MTATYNFRDGGLSGYLAFKAPCRVATTANITLSGLQTIDGVALVENDRVLVKDQSTPSENGIYLAATSGWVRAKDFDGALDVVSNTLVKVTSGTVGDGNIFQLTTPDPITVGTTNLTFEVLTLLSITSPGEWLDLGLAVTYVSTTQFTVPGDQTSTYQVNRRARVTATGDTFSMITVSTYDGGNDWTLVTLEDAVLTMTVTAVAVGFVSADDSSVDVRGIESTTEYAYKVHNLAATTAPVAGDDSGDGYSVGSIWIDTTADLAYVCLDATATAAVWLPVSPITTAGDIIIRGSSAAQRLAIGTPGQSLRVPNSGTGPSYGFMGGFEPIASLVASGESLIEFFHDGIDNAGAAFQDDWQYLIEYEDLICSAAKSMALQLFEAGAYRAGASSDDYWQARMQNNAGTPSSPYATTDTEIIVGVAPGTMGSGDAMNGFTMLTNLGSTSYKSYVRSETLGVGPSGGVGFQGQASPYGTNILRAATKLKVFPLSGGTIDAGRVTLSRRKLR